MQATNFSRKLDTSGRIMIPSKLREQLGMEIGKEYDFYLATAYKHRFICIDCGTVDKQFDLQDLEELAEAKGLKLVPKNED